MPYCSNCGYQLRDGAAFCDRCGAAVSIVSKSEEETQRKQVFVGIIKKCPSCGAELPGLVAVCPFCGHEITSSGSDRFLETFSDKLDDCELEILEENKNKQLQMQNHGWDNWSLVAKIFWVILNIFSFCLPLVLYFSYNSIQNAILSPVEKRKTTLIENFEVPNEKGVIISSLNYIGGKVSALSSQKATSHNWHWLKLWRAKANQIYKKAELLISGDSQVSKQYYEIEEKVYRVEKIRRAKRIGFLIAGILYITAITMIFIVLFQHINLPKFLTGGATGVRQVVPYILKWVIPLAITYILWISPIFSIKSKRIITVVLWGVLLIVFGFSSCIKGIEKHDEKTNSLSDVITEIIGGYGMTVSYVSTGWSNIRMDIKSAPFSKEILDNVEDEIKIANKEYRYELSLCFYGKEDITVRDINIDEHNVTRVYEDNTNDIPEKIVSICLQYGMKLTNYWSRSGSSVHVGETDVSMKISQYDKAKLLEFTDAIREELQGIDQRFEISISDKSEFIWNININEFGEVSHADAYVFRQLMKEVCDEKDAILEGVYSYKNGLSINVQPKNKLSITVNRLEKALIEKYRESEIDQFEIAFLDPDNQLNSFLHIQTDRSGKINRSES